MLCVLEGNGWERTCLGQLWDNGESLSEGAFIALITGMERGQFGIRAIILLHLWMRRTNLKRTLKPARCRQER